MTNLALSVIIPAYNEAGRLPKTLAIVGAFLAEHYPRSEVIVVDDGSRDATVAVVNQAMARYPVTLRLEALRVNQGKGAAVQAGMLAANGEYVLIADADNATPIEELPRLWRARTQAPIVISSRYLPESTIRRAQPLARRILSRAGNLAIRLLVGLQFTDTQNGFKLFRRQEGQDVFARLTITRWGFDIEVLVIARERGYSVVEVPVSWYDDAESKLRAGRDAWRTLRELLRIRHNAQSGRYRQKLEDSV